MKSNQKEKEELLDAMANEPMVFIGGDKPSIDDIANRIHIAWYEGAMLRVEQEAKAYGESLRTPNDNQDPIPKSDVENRIEQSWVTAEEVYGKRAAEMFKQVCPYDGALLCDLVFYSLLRKGVTKKEVFTTMDSFTETEWIEEIKKWEETIKSSFKALSNGKGRKRN